MFVYHVIHTSAQPEPEYPSGADHESIGTYATFEVAREAARNSLSRGSKKEYKYYKEGTTNDGPLESEGETDVEDEPHDDDDEERDRENFCIYTYHDYGDREMIRVEKAEVQSGLANGTPAAPGIASSANTVRQPQDVKAGSDSVYALCSSGTGEVTIYHVIRQRTRDALDETVVEDILGTYHRFKDARRAARRAPELERSQYHVYVEGRVKDDAPSHADAEDRIEIVRDDNQDDARGDTDFCIFAVDDEGGTETIRIQKGTLHAMASEASEEEEHEDEEAAGRLNNDAQSLHVREASEESSKPAEQEVKRKAASIETGNVAEASNKRPKHVKQVIEIESSSDEES